MKSLTGTFASRRGWALSLILLLGGGFLVAACGEEDTPTPTTPPPAPPPAPAPEPELPNTPAGLRIATSGTDFLEWTWTMVEGVSGYDVQFSTNEAFTAEDEIIARTAEEISYRRSGLSAGSSAYLRVRSAQGTGEERVTSEWSSHVGGMTEALPAAPPIPSDFRVAAQTESSITWSWTASTGAHGYLVQISTDATFDESDRNAVTTETSYTITSLQPGTTLYARVAAGVLTAATPSQNPQDYILSPWTSPSMGSTSPKAMAPGTPVINSTVERGEDFIVWTWNEVPGAGGYEVQFSPDGQFSGVMIEDRAADERSYRKEGLDPETFGYFRVRAYVMDDGERLRSPWTEAASAITLPPSVVAPSAPQGLHVSESGPTFIEWSWNPVPDVDGYQVRYSDNENLTEEDPIVDRTAEQSFYRKDGLEPNTTHYLQVRAYVEHGDKKLPSAWDPTNGVRGATSSAPLSAPDVEWDEDGTDHESIRWTWEAVRGADSYDFQFSNSETFPDDTPSGTTRNTWVEMSGREPRQYGYVRVQTVEGTGSTARRSVWSSVVRGRAKEAPAPAALPIPTEVRGSGEQRASITVAWTAVDGATVYEVQQREADSNEATTASCSGAGGNRVGTNRCVATGLTAGTPYQFRVRADATDRTRSSWSEWSRAVSTTGRSPTDTTLGGMGDLKIKWQSDQDSIDFNWERVSGASYEFAVLPDASRMNSENPCRGADWSESAIAFANHSVSGLSVPGDVRGLCVRTSEDGTASYVWGITSPEEPGPTPKGGTSHPGGTAAVDTKSSNTTAIQWGGVRLEKGFDYEIRVVVDPERSSQIHADTEWGSSVVQDACSSGTMVDRDFADITFTQTVTVDSDLKEYSGYLLCVRYKNDAGSTAWSVPVGTDEETTDDPAYVSDTPVVETFTRPGKPPIPTIEPRLRTTTAASAGTNELVIDTWSSEVRNVTNVPRQGSGFEASAWMSDVLNAKNLVAADCVTVSEDAPPGYESLALGSATDTGKGIQISPTGGVERLGFNRKVYVCLRATLSSTTHDEGGVGPWEISRVRTVKKADSKLVFAADSVTDTAAEVTITGWNKDWHVQYKEYDGDTTPPTNTDKCDTVGAGTSDKALSGLKPSTRHSVTAWDAPEVGDTGKCGGNKLGSVSFTTKRTQ